MVQTAELYAAFRWPAWSEHPLVIKLGDTEEELRSVCPVDLENEDVWVYEGVTAVGGNDPYLCSAVLDYARTIRELES